MAIIEGVQGLEVRIHVDGAPLDEHVDHDAPTKPHTSECYIESQSNAQFTVVIKTDASLQFLGECMTFGVRVDGVWAHEPILSREDHLKKLFRTITVRGKRISQEKLSPFSFSPLSIASDRPMSKDEATRVKDVGTIVVTVGHAKIVSKRINPTFGELIENHGTYSEKALKGRSLSHIIKFADPIPSNDGDFWKTVPIQDNSVAGSFRFNYCSKDALRSMLIIPRTPTPPPLETRDPALLSVTDIQEMQRRLQAQTSTIDKIKRERDGDSQRSSPRKVARLSEDLLEVGDGDGVEVLRTHSREPREKEIIEIDSD